MTLNMYHRAKEVLEAKMENSAEKLSESEMKAAYEAVGYGAVKYNDLKGSRAGCVGDGGV